MDKFGWTFLCGCAPFTGGMFCARERDDLADQEVAASTFYVWHEANPDPAMRWGIYNTVVSWRAQAMATTKPGGGKRVTVAIGTHGQYFEVEPETLMEQEGKIEGRPGPLRHLVSINEVILAAGMGRTVLRREGPGIWQEIGPGITQYDRDKVVGFEGIDGFSLNDLYAVGWGGEIWRYTNDSWAQIDSPTNANLNAVTCTSEGAVYAVGDNGAMVIGQDDQWTAVDTDRPETLQGVAEFGGEVFAVTDFKILRLTDHGLVPENRFRDGDPPSSCLSLWRAQDGIVSMGPKDLFRFSGNIWERIL